MVCRKSAAEGTRSMDCLVAEPEESHSPRGIYRAVFN